MTVHVVTHRWNAEEGQSPGLGLPDVGEIIAGRRDHWRVLEVRPIDSERHPNAWSARLAQLGPHHHPHPERAAWWTYTRPERAA